MHIVWPLSYFLYNNSKNSICSCNIRQTGSKGTNRG